MNKKLLSQLEKEFIKGEEILKIQEFPSICINKKIDTDTHQVIPYGYTITYWIDDHMVTVKLVQQENKKFTIFIGKYQLCKNIELQNVRKNLNSYKYTAQFGMHGVVVELSFTKKKSKSKEGKKNVPKKSKGV